MLRIRIVRDPADCRRAWEAASPDALITDLWEVRNCFHRHYRRDLHFVLAEDEDGLAGFLPLCWIAESECYGWFPGEAWHGRTWLEQNRLWFRDAGVLARMLETLGERYCLRYLLVPDPAAIPDLTVDEVGYLFEPPRHGFDFEKYLATFSGKSRKRLRRDLAAFDGPGVAWRHDAASDFDLLVDLNLARFGEDSYFHDRRFRQGFRDLADLLGGRGDLRMTTLLVGGRPAAVDLGCVHRGVYTLLAGGTDPELSGVAKLINTHHLERACRERLSCVDFLCGDFSWKRLFHLAERPLFALSGPAKAAPAHRAGSGRIGVSVEERG